MRGTKKLAVAVTAISLAGLGGGTAASAAQAQNEVLQATQTLGFARSGVCFGTVSASVNFSASGAVTGPYPGSFTETGRVGFSRRVYWQAGKLTSSTTSTLVISSFTITSGSTTITGWVSVPAGSGVSIGDCVNYYPGGLFANASNATYTAWIQTQGQLAETTVTGTAQVSGVFSDSPIVKGTPLSVTLLNFPSPTS